MPSPNSREESRPKVSAIITTFNEEYNLAACLESLAWCDEIMVVDSFSTDSTCEIARRYPNVQLHQHIYYGSAAQKNWAMDRASHEWILIFDADERCRPSLRDEILEVLAAGPKANSYTIRRRLFFLNRQIRFSGFRRDQVVRLIRQGHGRYPNRRVHADMRTSGAAPRLRHQLDHYMVHDLSEYVQRITKYGIWGAAQGWKEKRRSGILQFVGRPVWRFFRVYIIQLGILDGLHGLVFCLLQAYGTFVKWAVLWGWNMAARFGFEPNLPVFDENEETWAGLEELKAGNTG